MTDTNKNSPASQTLQLAQSHYASGRVLLAEEMYRQVLRDDPGNVQALHMLSLIAIASGRYGEAVEWVDHALKIKENDPVLFFTQGLALQEGGELDQALLKYKEVINLKPDYIQAHLNIGQILDKQERFDEAELRYRHVIVLQPGQADPVFNLAAALKNQKKFDEAVEAYKKVIVIRPDYADAYYNFGNLLREMRKPDEAAAQYAKAIALKPDMAEAYYNLGNVLRETGKFDEAAAQYAKTIALKPHMAEAYYNLGLLFNKRGMFNEEVLLFERLLTLQPDNPTALVELVHYINEACAWEKMGGHEARLLDMVRQEREGIFPSVILQTSATAEEQLVCARSSMRSEEKLRGALFTHDIRKSNDRIKIGYLSSDLHEHAVAYLVAEVFERHDRSRFDIIAYAYNPNDNSTMRNRLVKAFDRFVDVCDFSDREAAQKIYDDGIDILIDLKGLTGEARTGIPAYRPAPVQVNYLGYPGTMGASFIDYIIADRFIIPEDQERFYSEKVICLPDCYQPNDTQRRIAERVPTRKDCGLPEQGFVFCCFNLNLKIKPRVFDIWMRLLQKAPDSVLWLFESNLSVKGNLKQEAVRRGVNPERIVFAPRAPLPEHLARHQLADLFLDTLPINAHTTTSDALWAGLPVLTCVGSTFAGRVAGSLLKAANLPELITYSLEEYEALALQFAQNPAQLTAIRQKLQQTRLQVPLFDIERFTKNIEKSYQTMWDIWQAGDNPKAFTVS